MKNLKKTNWKTNITGVVIVILILVGCAAVIMKIATLTELIALFGALVAFVTAIGFFNTKDDNTSSLDKGVAEHLNNKFKKNEL